MSWQTYVDDHLMCEIEGNAGQHLSSAAIIGHDGSVWAQSSSFPKVLPPPLSYPFFSFIYSCLCITNLRQFSKNRPIKQVLPDC